MLKGTDNAIFNDYIKVRFRIFGLIKPVYCDEVALKVIIHNKLELQRPNLLTTPKFYIEKNSLKRITEMAFGTPNAG